MWFTKTEEDTKSSSVTAAEIFSAHETLSTHFEEKLLDEHVFEFEEPNNDANLYICYIENGMKKVGWHIEKAHLRKHKYFKELFEKQAESSQLKTKPPPVQKKRQMTKEHSKAKGRASKRPMNRYHLKNTNEESSSDAGSSNDEDSVQKPMEDKNMEITIDAGYKVAKILLAYLYSGQLSINIEDFPSLLSLVKLGIRYGLSPLYNYLRDLISSNHVGTGDRKITVAKAIQFLNSNFIERDEVNNIFESYWKFINRNCRAILSSGALLKVNHIGLQSLFWSNQIFLTSELDVFNFFLKLGRFICEEKNLEATFQNLRESIGELVYLIRFPTFPIHIFYSEVVTKASGFLKKTEVTEIRDAMLTAEESGVESTESGFISIRRNNVDFDFKKCQEVELKAVIGHS